MIEEAKEWVNKNLNVFHSPYERGRMIFFRLIHRVENCEKLIDPFRELLIECINERCNKNTTTDVYKKEIALLEKITGKPWNEK